MKQTTVFATPLTLLHQKLNACRHEGQRHTVLHICTGNILTFQRCFIHKRPSSISQSSFPRHCCIITIAVGAGGQQSFGQGGGHQGVSFGQHVTIWEAATGNLSSLIHSALWLLLKGDWLVTAAHSPQPHALILPL